MSQIIQDRIQKSIEVKQQILNDTALLERINTLVNTICDTFSRGGKVLFCGNGGSAADAQHLAAEFSGRFYKDRKPLPSEALHCNTSYLSAVANDYGFEHVYSRLLEGWAEKGDMLVALSTSGNSTNVLNAVAKAKEMGVFSVAFTGHSGGNLAQMADMLINVPSSDTPRIQEAHILIGHIACELVEQNLFGS